jgi:carbon storage regulator
MLVLTRKIDQGIVISGNIIVRVLGVERDRVKIGISAPLEVTILRQELLEREEEAGRKEGSTSSKVSTNEQHP